jgi:serine/threonine protein kinase
VLGGDSVLEIGSLVDGKYKILNKIGQGGMSVVYLAMNEKANKQWAIKEVRKDGRQNYEVVRQGLIAETDILKRLNHPNLPSIVDVIDDGESFLIVMDYIEGKPLSNALKELGAQPQEFVVEWAKQLCDVLGYLHSRIPPIIYRDMKPSNVMLKPDGNVTLIDFGTAREFKSDRVEDTTCLGTQGYAAPEQFGGRGQTDARTDIYCLGATMYHLVTGHNPAKPPYEMYPIRQWNPNLSSGLEQIILKCTRKNPEDRYQNCAELMYALDHYNELDYEYKKKQRVKFGVFVASALLTIGLGGTSFYAHAKENSIRSTTYDSYLLKAEQSVDNSTYEDYIKKAVQLDPSRADGFTNLLEHYTEDGVFEEAEASTITKLVNENDNQMKADQVNFANFAYKMGAAYWYNYGKITDGVAEYNGMIPQATSWFNQVELVKEENGKTNKAEYNNAQIYAKIGTYYAKLGAKKNEMGDTEVSYSDFWYDLIDLKNSEILNPKTQLYVYEDFITNIYKYSADFKTSGIEGSEISGMLTEIEEKMKLVTKDASNEKLVDYINRNLSNAWTAYNAAYGSTSTVGTGKGQ